MIKRSAILALVFTLGSVFLLVYASTHPRNSVPAAALTGKCIGKEANVYWNIALPSFFQLKVN